MTDRQPFVAVLEYAVIPYVMQTQRSKFGSKRAMRYNNQQVEMQADLAKWALAHTGMKFPIDYPVTVDFIAWYKTKHRRDVTNVRKAIEDALQGAGIIEDDNANIVVGSDFERAFLGVERDMVYIYVAPVDPLLGYERNFMLKVKEIADAKTRR